MVYPGWKGVYIPRVVYNLPYYPGGTWPDYTSPGYMPGLYLTGWYMPVSVTHGWYMPVSVTHGWCTYPACYTGGVRTRHATFLTKVENMGTYESLPNSETGGGRKGEDYAPHDPNIGDYMGVVPVAIRSSVLSVPRAGRICAQGAYRQ